MIWLGFTLAARCYHWLQAYAPTNRWATRLRTHPTWWGSLVSLVWGVACLVATRPLLAVIHHGGPPWLHLVVLWLAIDSIKLVLLAPFTLVWLARAHWTRRVAAR